ncbi:MAG: hypothetical protein B5M46_02145 [Epsilonproteobacteria bacterium 4484_20]|nr:MAG: hypothetical protein B5M46_02145 [Epsilonproteobacteria bacterium 4484_20]
MRYFNGFSLSGEELFFRDCLPESEFCVAGFSYGAQKAVEYVHATQRRVDRLILLSPAFFQTERPGFVRTQLRYFEAGKEAYVRQFLENVSYPSRTELAPFLQTGSKEELEALLTYTWDVEKMKEVIKRGTAIEVFLGGEDKIIDSAAAAAFFEKYVTTYLIKDAGHLLLSAN